MKFVQFYTRYISYTFSLISSSSQCLVLLYVFGNTIGPNINVGPE